MATYCPEDLVDSRELSCPICFEDYDLQDSSRAPKLLLCLHTFCFDCARKLWRNDGSLECSLCRMLHEGVRLDDLLDNHVIVQYLRQEFEMRDLEFAMKIEQELRQQDSIAAPASTSKVSQVAEELVVLEIPNASSESVDAEIGVDQDVTVELEEDTEEDDRHSLSNFIEDILEGFAPLEPQVCEEEEDEEDNDDDDDDDDNNCYEEPDVIEELNVVDEVETDEDHEEEDNTNAFFSLHIQALYGQSVEESDEEIRNEEENADYIFSEDSVQTVFDTDRNEDNDADEEDEDERWHSASDEINVTCWDENDALPMHDVDDMQDDTRDIFDWHIITNDSLLDD